MTTTTSITIRRAVREDISFIVAMLADDKFGSARERLEDPPPPSYFKAFETLDRDPNIQLVVAEEGGRVVGCLQLCVLPGLSSQGASRGLIEDVRVASDRRSRGIGEQLVGWAVEQSRAKGCKVVELLTHHSRVDAQRFYGRLGFEKSHVGMTIRFQPSAS
jgi:ribosomal protein S18 acetylase RimI-like enzyme